MDKPYGAPVQRGIITEISGNTAKVRSLDRPGVITGTLTGAEGKSVGDEVRFYAFGDGTGAIIAGSDAILWDAARDNGGNQQNLEATFPLTEAAGNFKMLWVEFGQGYSGPMPITPGNESFMAVIAASSNRARVYYLAGAVTWGDDMLSVQFEYAMRFYHTSATAGGTSTLNPLVNRIIGIR